MTDDDASGQSHEPPELIETERARWDAFRAAASDLGAAVAGGSEEEILAALTATQQAARSGMDMDRVRDSLHVPDDAGEHREALERMLRRIPAGWGRWISCSRGWYPLVVRLDEDLAAIDPDYELQQVKEKYGTMRFYADPRAGLDDAALQRFRGLIAAAEEESASICEMCGQPGELCRRGDRHPWYRTLCPACQIVENAGPRASGRVYVPVDRT